MTSAHCNVCDESLPDGTILDHFRVMHPDQFGELERWPDGSFVVVDQSDYTADEIA